DEIKASRQETTEQPPKVAESGYEGTVVEPFGIRMPSIAKPGIMGARVLRRLKVLGPGVLLGAVFALWVAWAQMPSRWPLADRAVIWATVMGGPISAGCWSFCGFRGCPGLDLLCLFTLLVVPLHPLHPNVATGCASGLGLCSWFVVGFGTAIAIVWGA